MDNLRWKIHMQHVDRIHMLKIFKAWAQKKG